MQFNSGKPGRLKESFDLLEKKIAVKKFLYWGTCEFLALAEHENQWYFGNLWTEIADIAICAFLWQC